MNLETARVLSQEELYQDTFLMWLSCPPVARGASPGRFLMIHCAEGYDPLLPRPISFHRFRDSAGERQFAILYDVRGRGTALLSERQAGDRLTTITPGGGGWGDPTRRSRQAVERDRRERLISAERAHTVYGYHAAEEDKTRPHEFSVPGENGPADS